MFFAFQFILKIYLLLFFKGYEYSNTRTQRIHEEHNVMLFALYICSLRSNSYSKFTCYFFLKAMNTGARRTQRSTKNTTLCSLRYTYVLCVPIHTQNLLVTFF